MNDAAAIRDAAIPLTPEQAEVVALPPEVRTLVTAGPGTGKTHVLIARLAYLVEHHGLSPGTELCALSFSRSAVREIRTRLAGSMSDACYVAVYTFDSYATRLLSMFEPEGDWIGKDYDGRIRAAVELLRTNDEARAHISDYRHIMVDEIQDLVAERAELVKAVLDAGGAGFTLFGDPAQGIYTWQLEGTLRAVGAAELYAWLDSHFADVQHRAFADNHRVRTSTARTALRAGSELNARSPNYERIKYQLDTDVMRLATGTLEHYVEMLRSPGMSTAILCRTNGQALVISGDLYGHGIAHRLQRRASDRAVPAWVAVVLGDMAGQQIGKNAFRNRTVERVGENRLNPEEAWRLLKQMDPKPTDTLDLTAVATRIRSGYVPDQLLEHPSADLVVSTVHRAKGLEFERVIIVESDYGTDADNELQLAEETRVSYVALTRARRELLHMKRPDTTGVYLDSATDRWVRGGFKRWQRFGFEVRGDDVHREDPAGGYLCSDSDPASIQGYIMRRIKEGDPVRLINVATSEAGEPRGFYAIVHGDRMVGVTSEEFGCVLYRALKVNSGWKVRWPLAIENLTVEGIDTVAGTDAAGLRCGLGSSGLWLRVRVAGFGRLVHT